ncbi:MAG: AarF/ABC1/UbiB kinase family protein, partial [Alphaproteobacteria bacterium]
EINLLDFGCIRVFEPKFVGGVIDLYYALRDGDMDLAVSAYEAWGFKDLTKEALEILNIWAAFLYAPLLEDRPRLIDENNIGQYGQAVAMDVHKRLKEYGGVTPPREFVLMDRAAIGLGSVFLRLNADLNWHRMFMELAEGFDRDRLARQQEEALAVAGLEPGA